MTQAEIHDLSRQADKAAAKVSVWPKWQQELAEQAVREPGRDLEPQVNVVVVETVQRALHGATSNPTESE